MHRTVNNLSKQLKAQWTARASQPYSLTLWRGHANSSHNEAVSANFLIFHLSFPHLSIFAS